MDGIRQRTEQIIERQTQNCNGKMQQANSPVFFFFLKDPSPCVSRCRPSPRRVARSRCGRTRCSHSLPVAARHIARGGSPPRCEQLDRTKTFGSVFHTHPKKSRSLARYPFRPNPFISLRRKPHCRHSKTVSRISTAVHERWNRNRSRRLFRQSLRLVRHLLSQPLSASPGSHSIRPPAVRHGITRATESAFPAPENRETANSSPLRPKAFPNPQNTPASTTGKKSQRRRTAEWQAAARERRR